MDGWLSDAEISGLTGDVPVDYSAFDTGGGDTGWLSDAEIAGLTGDVPVDYSAFDTGGGDGGGQWLSDAEIAALTGDIPIDYSAFDVQAGIPQLSDEEIASLRGYSSPPAEPSPWLSEEEIRGLTMPARDISRLVQEQGFDTSGRTIADVMRSAGSKLAKGDLDAWLKLLAFGGSLASIPSQIAANRANQAAAAARQQAIIQAQQQAAMPLPQYRYERQQITPQNVDWLTAGQRPGGVQFFTPGRFVAAARGGALSRLVKGKGDGMSDSISARLSDGEYVFSAQDVSDIGNGSTEAGADKLDEMRHEIRRKAGRKNVKRIAPEQPGARYYARKLRAK